MSELVSIVGDGYVLTSPEILSPIRMMKQKTCIFPGSCHRPANTEEVAAIMKLASCIRSPLLPWVPGQVLVAEPYLCSEELV